MAARLPESQVAGFTTQGSRPYLQTSPEYGMKILLARGSGDIYQLSRVFRNDPSAAMHNSEFTLIEWYRVKMSYRDLQEEALALINHLLQAFSLPLLKLKRVQYADLFSDLDPWRAQLDELNHIAANELHLHTKGLSREQLLDCIFTHRCAPRLRGKGVLWAVEGFPISYACFAKRKGDKAENFELFWQGVELANGCNEEDDIKALNRHFPSHRRLWEEMTGLPQCAGVALGFDRLFMLLTGRDSLFSFPYEG